MHRHSAGALPSTNDDDANRSTGTAVLIAQDSNRGSGSSNDKAVGCRQPEDRHLRIATSAVLDGRGDDDGGPKAGSTRPSLASISKPSLISSARRLSTDNDAVTTYYSMYTSSHARTHRYSWCDAHHTCMDAAHARTQMYAACTPATTRHATSCHSAPCHSAPCDSSGTHLALTHLRSHTSMH